jgi:hypothetical protein
MGMAKPPLIVYFSAGNFYAVTIFVVTGYAKPSLKVYFSAGTFYAVNIIVVIGGATLMV